MFKGTRPLMFVAVLLLAILLSIPGCTANQEEQNSRLSSHLHRLIQAAERGEAESFASTRDIELVDGSVRVVIECLPGQVEVAAEAATKAGAKLEGSYKDLLQALVPITSLTALAEAEGIRFIRLPVYAVEN